MNSSSSDKGSAYIDYYNKNNIIPVHQVINQLHRDRRVALYRTLGLHSLAFRSADILELGPGSGDNAVVLSELGVSSLTLVDGSNPSYEVILSKVKEGLFKCPTNVVLSNI